MKEIMLQNYLDPIAKVWGNEGVAHYTRPAIKGRSLKDKCARKSNKKRLPKSRDFYLYK